MSMLTATDGIRLTRAARVEVLDITARMTGHDRLETGGLLLCAPPRSSGLLEVLGAKPPGPLAQRGRDRYRPDVAHDLAIAERVRDESGATMVAGGGFHAHPAGWRSPSVDDLTFWSRWRKVLEVVRYVAVIAVPAEDGWGLEAFVIGSGAEGRDTCRRAQVT
jgi:hypothetical protein